MRKFLPILLTFLICFPVSSVALDFYLAGSCNDWKPNLQAYKFAEENGVYTLQLSSLSGDFKITTSDWSKQYGCASRIEYGKTYNCIQSDNAYNILLPEDPAENITIIFDYTKPTKTLRVEKAVKLYLVGDFNDWQPLPFYEFTFENGLYILQTNNFSGRFKIASSDYGYNFGSTESVVLDGEHLLSDGEGNDMTFAGLSDENGRIKITLNPSSSIDQSDVSIIEKDENIPTEFFNLQGVRVLNPSGGIFIVKRGDNVQKIFLP